MKIRPLVALRVALPVLLAGAAQAQESPLIVSAGLRAWNAQWTTFSYYQDTGNGERVLTQVPAKDKLVLIPLVSVRWRDFVGTLASFRSTRFEFLDGSSNERKELDASVGYFFAPSAAASIGYKKLRQSQGADIYELAGPTLGLSATAPLGAATSMYGNFGFSRMKDTPAATIKFKADYRLTEVGVAYSIPAGTLVRSVILTAGWRMQVLNSKEALDNQDGRDLTQGLTLGLVAVF